MPPEEEAQEPPDLTLAQVATRVGVSQGTVRRWVERGLVPGFDGRWTPSALAYVRVVARLRARGHSLERIKKASDDGQLAIGPIEDLLSSSGARHSLRHVSRESGLPAELVRQVYSAMGLGPLPPEGLSDEDLEMMRYAAAVLAAGFPLPAYLQLLRVYGQVMAQIADAEVRLMHLYVHKPLMRAGVPNVEIAEEMEAMTREVLPLASPFINYLHGRLLSHFVEQDLIGHVEAELGEEELEEGRLRVAVAFADLAGYARLTVEQGDEAALSTVERFVEAVGQSLPPDARVIKTLGDEVMVVGPDPAALTAWAVGLQGEIAPGEPSPRIGIHYGEALYRDGDYFGRDVNQAARVVARAGGGEVLVTRPVVDLADGTDGVQFARIGEVRLKGFSEPTELFTVSAREG
ncbi:MAG: adenylate cyclase [Solirubrobacteraceae bacterium]|nr:MerR family transcriptional regulator [Solirubrobacterales bacterium]MEA2216618.1 adenylate cyclase [Solirubrobacteraceae bacterium]